MKNLIDQLSQDLKPITPPMKAWAVTLLWILCSGALLGGGIVIFHRYRGDANLMLHSFQFIWIFTSLLFLSGISALVALKSAIPGKDLSGKIFVGLSIFFLFALVPLVMRGMSEPLDQAMSGLNPQTGWHCSLSLVMYSLLPMTALFWFIQKKLASTNPFLTGSLIGLSVGAFGAATLAWTCSVNEAVHLMVWHLIPILILSFIFAKLARKFLSF